jgi:hypothetical protein
MENGQQYKVFKKPDQNIKVKIIGSLIGAANLIK